MAGRQAHAAAFFIRCSSTCSSAWLCSSLLKVCMAVRACSCSSFLYQVQHQLQLSVAVLQLALRPALLADLKAV